MTPDTGPDPADPGDPGGRVGPGPGAPGDARPHPGGDDRARLEAALAAERAGAEHWRRVAHQREAALADLKARRDVRAALALDRRTAGVRARARALTDRARAAAAQVALAASAVPARGSLATRRAALDDAVATLPPAPHDPRSILVVVVAGDGHPHGGPTAGVPPPGTGGADREVVTVPVATGTDPALTVQRAVDAHAGDLVALLDARVAPLAADWLDRLAAAVGTGATTDTDRVVAATPLLVHPARPAASATAHDLRVRSVGAGVVVGADGTPDLVARRAGTDPDPTLPTTPVVAPAATCLLVDRAALDRAGGLAPLGDLDVSVVDLALRLRSQGGSTVCVPGSVAFDHRPVGDRDGLLHPLDPAGPPWRELVDRHGPALVRAAVPVAGLRFAVSVASPSRKVAARWGDWHLAEAMARGLAHHGHHATVQTRAEADSLASRSHDVHLVVRGLAPVRRTPGQRHVLWVISHPEDVEDVECDEADLVLVASHRFADELRTRTTTPVEVLLQATDPARFHPRPPDPAHRHEVTIVAKSRDVARPMVADAIAAGLRPAIHGSGWEGLVDPAFVVSGYVPNEELPVVYSSADVVLNDHWDTMRTWGFVSNRIFDVAACGTPVFSDDLPEVAELFGDLVPTWHTPEDLRRLVDELRAHPDRARERTEAARRLVLDAHTFEHRAASLLDALARHGLDRVP